MTGTHASLEERLWRQVERTDGCWEWRGARTPLGYGVMHRIGGAREVHRIAWELLVGPIPPGLFVLHHCDNPPCVRVDPDPAISHLFLGTIADNNADMAAKGRARGPTVRGADVYNARLTDADAADIRQLWTSGTKVADLARRHGVAYGTVSHIVHDRSYLKR